MINGMYLSTMGAMVQSSRHGIIANNLANTNTVGFKPDTAIIRSVKAESIRDELPRPEIEPILAHTGGGAWLDDTPTLFKMGQLIETGNPFNVSLTDSGDGRVHFFMIQKPGDEKVYYTRNGEFQLNNDGVLVNKNGYRVLSADGGEIVVPTDAPMRPFVDQDGNITNQATDDNEIIGQIGVVASSNPQGLKKLGDNLYELNEAQVVNAQEGVHAAAVEGSAADPIQEMTNMIEAQRLYQTNMRFISIQDESLGATVSQLGRVV